MGEDRGEAELTATLEEVCASLERRDRLRPTPPLLSLGRYLVHERLGSGASGTVYRATDQDRYLPVALKVLHGFGPAPLARFKAEFRVASRCVDECLVSVFELLVHEGVWAIAMDLADGPPLLEHLRPGPSGQLDEARLRQALDRIVRGLTVLHEAGVLHRDLKPSNVLVGVEGGVRIADFGIARLFDTPLGITGEGAPVGTPGYMAPEQALGRPGTAAADLYSLGVMLYQALTDALPFEGQALEVLTRKNLFEAPDPRRLAPHAPADLLALTRSLLRREASERPSLAVVRAALRGQPTIGAPTPALTGPALVGREQELQQVRAAFAEAPAAGPVLVRLTGPSGVGKSALVREVARGLRSSRQALVLTGRCHELESIPHKGFDAIVDELRQVLLHWSPEQRARRLDPRTAEVLPMFPVLEDVLPHAIDGPELAPEQRRRRATEALAAILGAVSALEPVVLAVDDAQWGDATGGWLLEAILAARPPCVRMVLLAYRDSEAAQSALLTGLDAHRGGSAHFRELLLEVGPLGEGDARSLARAILGPDDGAADRIAAESRGEPFLLEQLALAGLEGRRATGTVAELVLDRARRLGDEAFRLVEVAAVAGAPLPEQVLTAVAGARDARLTLARLVNASMLRRSGSGPQALVYPYHDRIRTSVEDSVDAGRKRALHRSIAELGEATGSLPHASLTRHFEAAGATEHAARHAGLAAAAAERALAFDSAAEHHARVIELSGDERARQEARCARARALFIAGRCDDAGAAFELAAQHAGGLAARTLERQAAEAYLGYGQVREAMALLGPLLERTGLPQPRSPTGILLGVARNALEVRWRTLLRPRGKPRPDPELAEFADLAWSGKDLCNIDPPVGVSLALASLSFAIRSGDAFRIARGLGFAGSGFVPGLVRVGERYLRWLSELAEAREDDHLRVIHRVSSGARGYLLGDWERCVRDSGEGLALAERVPAPTHWEQTIARIFRAGAYEYLGQYRRMEAESREHLRLIRGQGDRIGEVMATSGLGYSLAARQDGPGLDQVIEDMRRLMDAWTMAYSFWEAFRLRLRCLRALCWGDVRLALETLEEHWPRLEAHHLLRLPLVRYPLHCVRASVLLEAAAAGVADRRWASREVRKAARVLEGAARAEGPAAAALARAGLANLEGDREAAEGQLRRAVRIAGAGGMEGVEQMARLALAADAGERVTLVEALQARGVRDVSAWAHFVTPTFSAAP